MCTFSTGTSDNLLINQSIAFNLEPHSFLLDPYLYWDNFPDSGQNRRSALPAGFSFPLDCAFVIISSRVLPVNSSSMNYLRTF